MAPKAPTFCIAGAGIAGLTLALALAKYGAQVTILEQNSQIQEVGAGLQISPNAAKVLQALGLNDDLEKQGLAPQGINIFPFRAKSPLTTLTLGDTAEARYGTPYYVLHRADLAQLLHKACKRFANIDIHFGVSDFDVTEGPKGLTVSFTTPKGPETRKAKAFIGADGVGSPTRTKLLGGTPAINSGYVAWRTLIPMLDLTKQLSQHHTSLMWGPGFHAVAYPMPHRGQFNIALFTKQSGPANAPTLPKNVKSDPRFAAILESADDWTYWPLAAVRTPHWHRGPIGLIGDAAHAMLPFQAQGAAMSIEDAMCLAPLLMSMEQSQAAFAKFEQFRRKRVEKVARISASNGNTFHLGLPISAARDLVVRLQGPKGHFGRLDWIYNYVPPNQTDIDHPDAS